MPITRIEVRYPRARGEVRLRGSHAPLSWGASLEPVSEDGDLSVFEVDLPKGTLLEVKACRADGLWASGRNETVVAGDTLRLAPYFERAYGVLEEEWRTLKSMELRREVRYKVFLPPSYGELPEKRYPVLYAQDGQSLFEIDPFDGHSWELDDALNELWDLGAIEEVIVVALETVEDRLAMLSPVPDPVHGGGRAPEYRDFLVTRLKHVIDARYRTLPGRGDTAILGSSMGGLFAFFCAWTAPNVFGRAACLSSSFWWADRWMVHEAEKGSCPFPRPVLYIDSGAAKSAFTEDANLRDGFHHTQALRQALVNHCYEPWQDLHVLTFAGLSHDNSSWAARISVPLQILFPKKGLRAAG